MISHKRMVNNVTDTYYAASPTILEDGARWYYKGNLLIQNISVLTGHSEEHVAAAIAHLSTRLQWVRNVFACTALCHGEAKPSGIMWRSWDAALNALNSDDPLSTLNGPKVSAFAANLLLLDMNRVTVDVWGLRVASDFHEDKINLKHVGVYEKVERAFQVAALTIGVDASTVQAVTWCVARNGRSN